MTHEDGGEGHRAQGSGLRAQLARMTQEDGGIEILHQREKKNKNTITNKSY